MRDKVVKDKVAVIREHFLSNEQEICVRRKPMIPSTHASYV